MKITISSFSYTCSVINDIYKHYNMTDYIIFSLEIWLAIEQIFLTTLTCLLLFSIIMILFGSCKN